MHFLLQSGTGYRHDSKDDNYFICNLLLHVQATDDPVLITCGHAQPLPPLVKVHEVVFEGIQETMYCVKYCYGLYAHSLLGGPWGMLPQKM